MTELSMDVPVPKYYRLRESLRAEIESGELGEGEIIPSERELCEQHGVSRMTARQAVMELVNEGFLYRQQGRGTFVAGEEARRNKVQQEAARLTSFTQDMRERGMAVSSVVLKAELESAGPALARILQIAREGKIVRLKRLRNADGEPMALEVSHLIHDAVQNIPWGSLGERSLYEELDSAGVRVSRAEQSYEAALVGEEAAEHLGVPAGSPALLIERVTFDADDRPFEYVRSTYRGDRYRITTTLRP